MKFLTNGLMASVAAICLLPATGLADTIFSFSNLGTVGSVTGSGATEVATITVNNLNINGTTVFGNSFTETYTNSTGLLTFSGTGTGADANLTGTFFSIQEATNLLAALPLNAVSIYSAATSLTFSTAFLTDLGLAGDPTVWTSSTSPSVSNVSAVVTLTASGSPPDNVSSTVTTFDVAAIPEPSTFTMFGMATLLGLGGAVRRKFGVSPSGK